MSGDFRDETRRLMAEQDISLRELARRTHYTHSHLSMVLNGKRPLRPDMAERIAEALGGGLVVPRPRALARPLDPDDDARLLQAARKPSRVDARVVASLATVLAGQRRTEDAVGSAPLLEPVRAQLAIMEPLVHDASGTLRPKLLDVAGQWAQFCGWLHANSGDHKQAAGWYANALEWASECGNENLAATVLSMRGYSAWATGQIGPMVGLSAAAARRATTPGVKALAVQQEARGHALAGAEHEADRQLDLAADLADCAAERSAAEPDWVYFYSPDYLVMQRARAYRYLGRYIAAVELLRAGLTAMPEEVRGSEWYTSYVFDLAAALAAAGEPKDAASIAREVLAAAQAAGSRPLLGRLRRLHARLAEQWPGVPAVAELGEQMAGAAPARGRPPRDRT